MGHQSNILVLTLTLALLSPQPQKAEAVIIDCNAVLRYLSPCINYVLGSGGAPPPQNCCTGVKGLYGVAKTTPDRQKVCNCIKSVAAQAPNQAIQNAASLPGKCGVNLPYKIDPNTDCAKIK